LAETACFDDFDENFDAIEFHDRDLTLGGTMFPRFAV
jgi:hypothetical protein